MGAERRAAIAGAERFGFEEGLCPVAEDVSSRSLALPFFTGIEANAQERVAEVLASAL